MKRVPVKFDLEAERAAARGSSADLLGALLGDTRTEEPELEMDSSVGADMRPTSSSNPTKPRTLSAGYDRENGKLIVVFRDGTWWEYRGVSPELWESFRLAESKGKFLASSGLDNWADMGPADVGSMPVHRRVQIQNGLIGATQRDINRQIVPGYNQS